MGENLLEIKNLSVEYHTDDAVVYAVNNISLEVKKGESIGLGVQPPLSLIHI